MMKKFRKIKFAACAAFPPFAFMASMNCLLSTWSVTALPVPHREEGEARGGREGQEGKELTKSHGIVDVDCLYCM